VADGTYLIRPLDEGDVGAADRTTLCARQVPGGLCFVSTKEHLLALAEATARRPLKEAEIAVIVGDSLKPAPAFIDVRR
jgi:hypothetical protein